MAKSIKGQVRDARRAGTMTLNSNRKVYGYNSRQLAITYLRTDVTPETHQCLCECYEKVLSRRTLRRVKTYIRALSC